MHLVDWLIERQNGQTDAQFADFLGVSRPLWTLIKLGLRKPSAWFIVKVLRAYPSECQTILTLESDSPHSVA